MLTLLSELVIFVYIPESRTKPRCQWGEEMAIRCLTCPHILEEFKRRLVPKSILWTSAKQSGCSFWIFSYISCILNWIAKCSWETGGDVFNYYTQKEKLMKQTSLIIPSESGDLNPSWLMFTSNKPTKRLLTPACDVMQMQRQHVVQMQLRIHCDHTSMSRMFLACKTFLAVLHWRLMFYYSFLDIGIQRALFCVAVRNVAYFLQEKFSKSCVLLTALWASNINLCSRNCNVEILLIKFVRRELFYI